MDSLRLGRQDNDTPDSETPDTEPLEGLGRPEPSFSYAPSVSTEIDVPTIAHTPIPQFAILCAEPGMGKSHILTTALRDAEANRGATWLFSFEGSTPAEASERIVRLARDLTHDPRAQQSALICVDDLPSSDEFEVARQAKALRRIVAEGNTVLVAIRPDAEQLAEELWDAACFRTADLLYRPSSAKARDGWLWKRTHGIASLVNAMEHDLSMGVRPEMVGTRYATALESLVRASLRQRLADEELRARAVLILLGSGSFDELAYIYRRLDSEAFAWLHDNVPLFGIDLQQGSFCCAGISEDIVFSAVLGAIPQLAAAPDDVIVRVGEVLVARGDGFRASLLCKLLESERTLHRLACRWGISFCEAGMTGAILGDGQARRRTRRGERDAGQKDPASPQDDIVQLAVRALVQDRRERAERDGSGDGKPPSPDEVADRAARDPRARTAYLMAASRNIMTNGRVSDFVPTLMMGGGEDQSAWFDHIEARSLLMTGRFSRAYELLTEAQGQGGGQSLSRALCADDLLIAELMTGGVPDQMEWDAFQASQGFFARSDIGRLRSYSDAMMAALAALLSYGTNDSAVSALLARAETSGDDALLAWVSLASAVCQQRMGATTHAHVRARRAITLAEGLGLRYVESAARLVDAVLLELMGEGGALLSFVERPEAPTQLRRLAVVVLRSLGFESPRGFERVEGFLRSSYGRDHIWALGFVLTACGDLSREVARVTPSPWLETHRMVRGRQSSFFASCNSGVLDESGERAGVQAAFLLPGMGAEDAEGGQSFGEHPVRVRIAFFGGFSISVEGTEVPERLLVRRKSKLVIALLGLVHGHQLKRAQILEEVWREPESSENARRIYEAMSVIRRVLGDRTRGIDPIVLDRGLRQVAFDPDVVSSDVDDFEREARAAVASEGDDEATLAHANAMQQIYRDGPDVPLRDLGSLARTRRAELVSLYVDVSILGAEAALRTGRPRMAVRFASQAHAASDLREDAVRVLVDALGQSGRLNEVADVYRRYCRRIIDERGMPPSSALRHDVERMLEGGRASSPQLVRYAQI